MTLLGPKCRNVHSFGSTSMFCTGPVRKRLPFQFELDKGPSSTTLPPLVRPSSRPLEARPCGHPPSHLPSVERPYVRGAPYGGRSALGPDTSTPTTPPKQWVCDWTLTDTRRRHLHTRTPSVRIWSSKGLSNSDTADTRLVGHYVPFIEVRSPS